MNRLILFYLGSHADNRGRFLSDILQQDDVWFETCHDYIQWLFPNKIASRVTPDAPTITPEIKKAFRKDELLREHLMASFQRILSFYGLKRSSAGIVKADNWALRKGNWFTQSTHNDLRITRVIKCLVALGLKAEAVAFYDALCCLQKTQNDCGIEAKAYPMRHTK